MKIERFKLVLKFSDKLPKKITVNLYCKIDGIILRLNNLRNHSTIYFKKRIIEMMQRGLLLFFLSGISLIFSGCSNFNKIIGFTKEQATPTTCASVVIERAFKLHEDAKSGLAMFFDERSENQLYRAFYAASDSVYESLKVKNCWDRRISHYYAMQNLQEMNTSLARIIRRNMPDDDQGEICLLYTSDAADE